MTEAAKIVGVTLENFWSYERADYTLDRLGLTMIEGVNRDDPRSNANGVGKSAAFLNAPTWCLFGEGAAGVSADDVVNDLVGKNCAVTVRLVIPGIGDVTVQRFRKVASKNGLRLWIGAHVADLADAKREDLRPLERTSLDAAETQRQIHDVLGLDLEVWRAAVYRAQDDDRRFAALTDSQQKDVLSRVFELHRIDEARVRATTARVTVAAERAAHAAKVEKLEVEAAGLRLDDLRAAHAAWQATQAQRLAELDAQLAEITAAGLVARANTEAWQRARDELAQLRAAPPPVPGLEPIPPAPGRAPIPPGPSRPVAPTHVEIDYLPRPPEPPRPVAEPLPPEVAAFTQRAQAARIRATELQTQARGVAQTAETMRLRAAAMRARRSGRCDECGSELTPEHADREAARIDADALATLAQHGPLTQAAEAAKAEAAACEAEAARLTSEHTYRAQGAARAYEAALESRRRACAEVDREERRVRDERGAVLMAAFRAADEAWQREETARHVAHDEAHGRALAAHQATVAEVTRRNAERTASARGAWEARRSALEAEAGALSGALVEYQRLTDLYRQRHAARERVAAEVSPTLPAIERGEKRAAVVAAELEAARAQVAALDERLRIIEWWIEGFGPRGLKSFVLDERIQELTDRTNEWLRILTAGVYWVRFETQSATKAGKITDRFALRVFRHAPGGTRSRTWGQWSGGQKCRIGVAIDLALADAIAARASRAWDLLVLDEVFRGLDAGGRQAMLDALAVLRRTRGSVLVVEHDPEFRASFERRVVVELQNERSRIVGVS